MYRNFSKRLAWLLILAVFAAGVDAALSEALHAGHDESSFEGSPGNTTEGDEHDGHCCHAAGHLTGVVSGTTASLMSPTWLSLPKGASLLSQPGQAPPTPPPNR